VKRKENSQLPWSETKSYAIKVVRVSEGAPSCKIDHPKRAATYWRHTITSERWFDPGKEHLVAIILSTRYGVHGHSLVSIGSLNESIAHPREIFRAAVAGGGYGIILMHNHPSGDPSPSESDQRLTKRITECGELLQIPMIDHIIVGKGRLYFSFKESEKNPKSKRSKKRPSKRS